MKSGEISPCGLTNGMSIKCASLFVTRKSEDSHSKRERSFNKPHSLLKVAGPGKSIHSPPLWLQSCQKQWMLMHTTRSISSESSSQPILRSDSPHFGESLLWTLKTCLSQSYPTSKRFPSKSRSAASLLSIEDPAIVEDCLFMIGVAEVRLSYDGNESDKDKLYDNERYRSTEKSLISQKYTGSGYSGVDDY